MRTISFFLALLFSVTVVSCGGGSGYGGGSTGGNTGIYSISGTVTFTGNPLMGAMISLTGTKSTSTTTDGSGNYSFTSLPNGGYTVTPSGFGYTYAPTSTPVTVNGNNPTGVDFVSS